MTGFFKDRTGKYIMPHLMAALLFCFFVAYNITFWVLKRDTDYAFNVTMLGFCFFPELLKLYIESKFPHLKNLVE